MSSGATDPEGALGRRGDASDPTLSPRSSRATTGYGHRDPGAGRAVAPGRVRRLRRHRAADLLQPGVSCRRPGRAAARRTRERLFRQLDGTPRRTRADRAADPSDHPRLGRTPPRGGGLIGGHLTHPRSDWRARAAMITIGGLRAAPVSSPGRRKRDRYPPAARRHVVGPAREEARFPAYGFEPSRPSDPAATSPYAKTTAGPRVCSPDAEPACPHPPASQRPDRGRPARPRSQSPAARPEGEPLAPGRRRPPPCSLCHRHLGLPGRYRP